MDEFVQLLHMGNIISTEVERLEKAQEYLLRRLIIFYFSRRKVWQAIASLYFSMQEKSAAVIVAAGSSRRMQGHDKLWIPLAGRITLARTVDVFQASPVIDTIVLVTNAERLVDTHTLCEREQWDKVT